MKMGFTNQLGSIYSQEGLRFGGFKTSEFIELTELMEEKHPQIRERIIAEAHYQIVWLACFPDIVFVASLLIYGSLLRSILLYVLAYSLEYLRLNYFGPSRTFSYIGFLWGKTKFVVYALTVIYLLQVSISLSITIIIFAVLEGYIGIIGTLCMLPISFFLASILSREQSIEGYVLHWTILKEKRNIEINS